MHRPIGGHGPSRCDERLTGHLTAEHPLHARLGAEPAEDVLFDLFEVEQIDQTVERDLVGCRLSRHGA